MSLIPPPFNFYSRSRNTYIQSQKKLLVGRARVSSWVWWYVPIIPVLGRSRRMRSLGSAWAVETLKNREFGKQKPGVS